jgi:hypothetical protein
LGLLIGAAVSWVLARSRQRQALAEAAAAALQVSTQLQVEMSSLKEHASRIAEAIIAKLMQHKVPILSSGILSKLT